MFKTNFIIKRLLIVFTLPVAFTACKQNKTEVKPVYRPLVEAIYASGNMYPGNDYKIFSKAEGFLTARLVEEGMKVGKNQPLFHIESDQQDIRLSNAADVYRMALSNYGENSPVLMSLKASLEASRNKMRNDSVNYIRYKNLLAQNATSQVSFDQASLAYRNSSADYKAQREKYSSTRNQLYIEMENAKSQYGLISKDKAHYTVNSEIAGTVYEIYKKDGEPIGRQEPLAMMGDGDKPYLKLTIDELDAAKVKTGQTIEVKIDAYKGKVFKAKVTKVYPMLKAMDQSIRVDAEFVNDYPQYLSGLTVEANIIISQKEKTLTIPAPYIFSGDSVMVKTDGKPKAVKIKKGAENMESVEVLSGLDENTIILKK